VISGSGLLGEPPGPAAPGGALELAGMR
jgi:hypothetical protein